MFKYYCPKCERLLDFKKEVVLWEEDYEGDYQEFHEECETKVDVILK